MGGQNEQWQHHRQSKALESDATRGQSEQEDAQGAKNENSPLTLVDGSIGASQCGQRD